MKEAIGEIICMRRQDKKMTQEEFASRLGVTSQAVSKWERGNGLPDITLVEGICRILDLSANTLLGIDNNKVVENRNLLMEKEIRNNMYAEPLLIDFGLETIPCIAEGLKTDYINQKRKELVQDTGMLLPLIRLKDNWKLKDREVRILSYDRVLWVKEFERTDENTFHQIIDQVITECIQHYAEIINKQVIKTMVDNLKELYPGIADGLIPEKISYLALQRKLQSILADKGNIRDLIHILEDMEENLQ
jgi:flagellar biosynthesis component FlhA